jgi:uncharacterized protein
MRKSGKLQFEETGAKQPVKVFAISLFCGLIFGLGLIVSGMSNPARVLNFFDWSQRWYPTLALVLGGAIGLAMPRFHWVRKRQKPLLTDEFDISDNRTINAKLIIGASLFGIGRLEHRWLLSPGPGILAMATLQPSVLIFVAIMLIGIMLQHWLSAKRPAPDG